MADDGTPAPDTRLKTWSLPARLGFRFAFIYWPLFFFADYWPSAPVVWVGRHLLDLSGEAATPQSTGSGDRALNYVQVFCTGVLALVGASVWSAISRRREDGTLYAWLRLLVRFGLSYVLLSYGFYKVFVI